MSELKKSTKNVEKCRKRKVARRLLNNIATGRKDRLRANKKEENA